MIPKLLPISPRASSSEPLILLTMHSAPCTKNYAPATKYQELGIHEVPSTMHHASLITPLLLSLHHHYASHTHFALCSLHSALCTLQIANPRCHVLRTEMFKMPWEGSSYHNQKSFFRGSVLLAFSIFKCLCCGPISPCVIEFSLHILFLCASRDDIKLHCLTLICSRIYAVQC